MTTVGLLFLALLPAAAAVSPVSSPEVTVSPAHLPIVIAQPVATMNSSLLEMPILSPLLLESMFLAAVGTTLFALGSLVRRVTNA